MAVPIPFPELMALLDDQVPSVQSILGRDLIGIYIVGSFALGDADMSSDCDFITVVRHPLSSRQEDNLGHSTATSRPETASGQRTWRGHMRPWMTCAPSTR